VREQIVFWGKNGGYVLVAVHNTQDDVPPPGNILTKFGAAKEFGRYPLDRS